MAASSIRTGRRTRSGMVTFAGVLFLIVGAFNLLDGVVALVNDKYFVADELLFGDLSAWGVWFLICGTGQALTGWALLARRPLSIVFGITIAALNALTQLMWSGAYPAGSAAAMVVDGLIIWTLATHVGEFAQGQDAGPPGRRTHRCLRFSREPPRDRLGVRQQPDARGCRAARDHELG